MKKILTPVIALSLSMAATATPAHASMGGFTSGLYYCFIGLLLPAVQAAREAAR